MFGVHHKNRIPKRNDLFERIKRWIGRHRSNIICYEGKIERTIEKPDALTLEGKVRAVKQKERRVDALALGAEEGRDKLRKATVRSTYPMTRRSPNGETHMDRLHVPYHESIVIRREPAELKHLSRRRKRKKHRFRK